MRFVRGLIPQRGSRSLLRRIKTTPALLGPEALESRQLFAVSPFAPFTGKDTDDPFMVPATKAGDLPNPQWNMEKIRAADVWWVYDGSPKSVVVVEDYGLDYRHEDFGGSALTQGQFWDYGKIFAPDGINFEFSKKGRDDFHDRVDPERKDTLDPNWNAHTLPDSGQYLGNIGAGIIGAKTNNGLGVAGINWDVQLYSSKVVVNDTTSHDIIAKRANRMVQYLRMGYVDGLQAGWTQNNPNPQLIRAVSFGYCTETDYGDIFHWYLPASESEDDGAGHYDFVALGQGIATTPGYNATSGILVTVPTGDYGKTWPTKYYDEGHWAPWTPWTKWDPVSNRPLDPKTGNPVDPLKLLASGYGPGDPDNVIAVAATDINDVPWVGNAKNPIDIYAPGVDIRSIGDQPRAYDLSSGTRQAQAHVAGAISLLYDVAQQHGFSPTYHQVREAIIEGGDNIGADKPRLNVLNSIKYLSLLLGKDLTRRPDPLGASISITGGSGLEGDVGSSSATFTLTLSRAIDVPVTIGVKVEDGTAMAADRDFMAPAGVVMVTIPARATSATFTVNVIPDARVESNEFFTARIVTAPVNIVPVLGLSSAAWTIVNDDTLPKVSLAVARALEGSATQPGWARVFATLDKAGTLPVTVQYAVVDGTARVGVDFRAPTTNVVTFRAGVTSVPIDIPLIGDAIAEPDEAFQVQIDSVVNGTTAPGRATAAVTIVDDDRIRVSVTASTLAAVVGGTGTMLFVVSLSRAPTAAEGAVQVSYRTVDGVGASAALAGTDYQSALGMLTFNPGETTKTIAVTVLARRSGQRYPRDFSMQLSGVSAAIASLPNGLATQTVVGRIS